jgi:exopolysaccharide biosynthesis polyprenyl glycosylphosphotransferase
MPQEPGFAWQGRVERPVFAASLARILVGDWRVPGGRWVQVGYLLADLSFVALNSLLIFYCRFVPDWPLALLRGEQPKIPEYSFAHDYWGFLFLYAAFVVLLCQRENLYRTSRTRIALDEALAVFRAVALATFLLIAFVYLSNTKTISRLVVGSSGVLNILTLSAWRFWKRKIVERRACQGLGVRNVLIVGTGTVGQDLARYLEDNRHLGFVVKGFLDGNHSADPLVLGKVEDFAQVARAQFIDEVFITTPSEKELVRKVAVEARRNRVNVKVVPELYDGFGWLAQIEHLGGFPIMALHREPIPVLGLFAKRLLDVFISAAGLLVLAPILAAIALAIKLDSPGPILYRSLRVGRKGRKFVCFKFRTMVANADKLKDALRHLNERQGPFFKIANDPRVTRVGRLLRKYSLDELPQLWNVFSGEMSLVGPRPHPSDDYAGYSLEHLRRLDVTPGISGLWQVAARQDPSFQKNMLLDLEYIENWSLWFDVKILFMTLPAVLRGMGE